MIYLKVSLGQDILNKIPSFKIGLNHYTKITVSESPQMLKGRLQLFQEQLFFELEEKKLTDFPGIQEWRDVWKTFEADSSQYHPSIESLMRKIKEQNYLTPVNSAVDMNHFLSLQYVIPIGLYDTKLIEEDVVFHIGTADTAYEELNGPVNHLKNIIVCSDNQSAFGSPYVNSERTAVTEQTTSVIQVFFLRPSMTTKEATELLQAASNMFTTIHGGEATSNVLHAHQNSVMLSKQTEIYGR